MDNTVTTGIVSGTGRSSAQVGIGDKRINFIQTDLLLSKEARRPEGFNQGLARFAYPKVSHKGIPQAYIL